MEPAAETAFAGAGASTTGTASGAPGLEPEMLLEEEDAAWLMGTWLRELFLENIKWTTSTAAVGDLLAGYLVGSCGRKGFLEIFLLQVCLSKDLFYHIP